MTSIHDTSPFRVGRKSSVAMSPRIKLVLIPPAPPHVIWRDLAGFPSKAMDQIVRHRCYLGVCESPLKRRHECSGINSAKVRSREQRLHEIGAVGVIHGLTAFKRRVARLPSLSVPKVAADAVGFKKPFAETVVVILGSRLFGICFIDWGERPPVAGRARLRLDRPQIANERRGVGGCQVLEAVGDRFAHRARSRTTAFGVTGLEIIENLT